MTVNQLSSTDAFYVLDLDDAPRSTGVVRWAKKILVDGAENLARGVTYSYAALGIQAGGASAGVNAAPDGRDAALRAFVDELAPVVAAGTLRLTPGKGVSADDLAGLSGPEASADGDATSALVSGIIAAATAAVGGLDGRKVALEASGLAGPALRSAFEAAGAEIVADGPDALASECDVLAVGSKAGVVDHENVADLAGRTIVPVAPLAVTTRAVASGRRAGVTILPDFVTTAGPLVDDGRDPADVIAALIQEIAGHAEGPSIGACERAEAFLSTWRDSLPFGRPI